MGDADVEIVETHRLHVILLDCIHHGPEMQAWEMRFGRDITAMHAADSDVGPQGSIDLSVLTEGGGLATIRFSNAGLAIGDWVFLHGRDGATAMATRYLRNSP